MGKNSLEMMYIMEVPNFGGYTSAHRNIDDLQGELNKFPGGEARVSQWSRTVTDWKLNDRFSLVSSTTPLPSSGVSA